ncbi:Protein of unknown function, DUF488 [Bradyrhizobium sp. Rc2d]|uniref:DUF488 domain-containing protein n=1 Tax=Bradyrhizobium sp. Rc2d TaxID=1855321 RepID=UPI00088CA649|nr:DUF488 domain-containing protein [Bradyrhizobium sp. Rc2d]SDI56021.1 Protein of unknown function, DUF488 [Bradyrhizobium sp. Rc2d]
MAHPFFTIGHATRAIEEFIELLQGSSITYLADVRTVPRSRTNPQYNRDTLPQSLAAVSIGYEHIASLGGLRSREREVPRETNAFWQNGSFHNYADHAMSATFHEGLAHLRDLGQTQRCAIMCAEALWWRCHRRIIADYLLAAGETVFHILGPGQVKQAEMNPAARVMADGRLVYPAES